MLAIGVCSLSQISYVGLQEWSSSDYWSADVPGTWQLLSYLQQKKQMDGAFLSWESALNLLRPCLIELFIIFIC
jgi:hypothetical protein